MITTDAIDTRERLILAAVRLMAEKGVHGVSLREINTAAGTRNHSAANYYFNDKHGLVVALLDFGRRVIGPPVSAMVETIDRRLDDGQDVPIRDILAAGFGANVALIRDPGYGRHQVRALSRIVFEFSPDVAGAFNDAARPLYEKMLEQLTRLDTGVAQPDLRRRLILTGTAALHVAANIGVGDNTPLGDVRLPDDGTAMDYLFNYFASSFAGHKMPDTPLPGDITAGLAEIIARSRSVPFDL